VGVGGDVGQHQVQPVANPFQARGFGVRRRALGGFAGGPQGVGAYASGRALERVDRIAPPLPRKFGDSALNSPSRSID